MKDKLLASFMFFTRLPFWRVFKVSDESFKYVVHFWPYVGILTGGVMALTLLGLSEVLPYSVAIICAIAVRILLTGALHEDGLADFFDGFGGGTSKTRILEIMKDSHIGTYGVLGLIFYYLLLFSILYSIPLKLAVPLLFTGDITSKLITSQIVNFLPYARKEEESKAKVIYNRIPIGLTLFTALLVGAMLYLLLPSNLLLAPLAPIIVFTLLIILMRNKLGGYTGDCCGATVLLCELFFYFGVITL